MTRQRAGGEWRVAAVVIAVAHEEFVEMGADRMRQFGDPDGHILYDLKYVLHKSESDVRL